MVNSRLKETLIYTSTASTIVSSVMSPTTNYEFDDERWSR